MKKLTLLILMQIVLLCTTACAQKDFQRFYNKHSNDTGVECFELSTSLFRLLLKSADPSGSVPKNIDRVSILITESSNAPLRRALYDHLPGRIYTDLMNIEKEGSRVNFKIRKSRNGIEELIMIANEENSLFVISVKGFLSIEEAEALTVGVNNLAK